MLSARNVLTYAALGLLAVVSGWLADRLSPMDENGPRKQPSLVDYYSRQIKRIVLTEDGKPDQVLFAETMTHYQKDDRTEMDRPEMTLYREGKPPWVIQSETATLVSGDSAVLLNGEVLIKRDTDAGETLQIITRNVKYDPKTEYAETAEDVIIRSPKDETHATGMQVYFKPQLKFNLLAEVRRKHEIH